MASKTTKQVSTRIRMELARTGRRRNELGEALEIPDSTLTRRFSGETEWTFHEVLKAADFFGVPITDLTPNPLTEES
jgi:hypothetical protein